MSLSANLPTNRAVLFANLGQALTNGEKFPGLFETSADISPVCYRGPLLVLAAKIRKQPEKPLLVHLENAGIFFPWEIRLIRFGLATLKIAEVFARLCDYYILVGTATAHLARWASGLWILLSCSFGYLLALTVGGSYFVMGPAVLGILAGLVLFGMGLLLSPAILKSWIEPNSILWMKGARIPLLRSLVVVRSVYQYLMNLGLCIQGGFDLDRSLKITARSEPVRWLRQRYQGVADDVAGGTQISKAFISRGILTETRILAGENGAKATGALWEPGITDIVRQSFARQLTQASRLVLGMFIVLLIIVWMGLLYTRW